MDLFLSCGHNHTWGLTTPVTHLSPDPVKTERIDWFSYVDHWKGGHMREKHLDLGQQVKKFRDEAGLTQEALGEKVYMSKQQISKIETGETALKGEDVLSITRALGISPNKFFGYEGFKSVGEILREGSVLENKLITLLANVIHEEMHSHKGK